MTAIIIDDETKGRLALRQKLADHCAAITIVAEAAGGTEGIQMIKQHKPDIVFLDIEMPLMNGFDMLAKLEEKNFHLIFTTAYDQYAIKAIKYAALDYLLKPVDIEELKAAVSRIIKTENLQTGKQVEILHEKINFPMKQLNKLAVPTVDGLFFYNIKDIIRLEASSNYTVIYLADKSKITAAKTLKDFEDLLPEELFFRTHHSSIINLQYIKRYIKGDGGQIELTDGSVINVSRRKKEDFIKVING